MRDVIIALLVLLSALSIQKAPDAVLIFKEVVWQESRAGLAASSVAAAAESTGTATEPAAAKPAAAKPAAAVAVAAAAESAATEPTAAKPAAGVAIAAAEPASNEPTVALKTSAGEWWQDISRRSRWREYADKVPLVGVITLDGARSVCPLYHKPYDRYMLPCFTHTPTHTTPPDHTAPHAMHHL